MGRNIRRGASEGRQKKTNRQEAVENMNAVIEQLESFASYGWKDRLYPVCRWLLNELRPVRDFLKEGDVLADTGRPVDSGSGE